MLPYRFQMQASLQPYALALETSEGHFTYAALHTLVDNIARHLKKHSVHHKAVMVFNDHSVFSYAAILALQITENAVLPVDASGPRERILEIVATVKPAGIIVSQRHEENKKVIAISLNECPGFLYEAGPAIFHDSLENNPRAYEGIAYIIFTSGSTGKPKGVPVKQESLDAFLLYFLKEYDFNPSDRFLQVYDITFDVAYFSFLVPLCCGGCCCILNAKKGTPKYLSILADLLSRDITVVSMVPAVLHYIKKYIKNISLSSLRYSFFSGDALYEDDAIAWKHFIKAAALHNFYGPTETTIVCTRYVWGFEKVGLSAYNGIVPIGRPFLGMEYKIVDDANGDVASGAPGELAFSGVQVIDHYIQDANAAAFFEEGGKRYYKTGDIVHLDASNNLVFRGRKDSQVKINGYRVELAEIEAAITKQTGRKNVVLDFKNSSQITFLKAYVEAASLNEQELKRDLASLLPEYMIPSRFIFLEQLPLNENGKTDRLSLKNKMI